jgi:hypothetical protein
MNEQTRLIEAYHDVDTPVGLVCVFRFSDGRFADYPAMTKDDFDLKFKIIYTMTLGGFLPQEIKPEADAQWLMRCLADVEPTWYEGMSNSPIDGSP